MPTKGTITTAVAQKKAGQEAASVTALGLMVDRNDVKKRFEDMLGKNAGSFLSSLMTLVNQEKNLQKCDPRSVLSGAAKAAALQLPLEQSLGLAWLIPYGDKATFQIGVKGLIQLAQRSGKMKSIVAVEVYEGEIQNWNKFTETYTSAERKSDKVVGYFARFETINGFAKAAYWTKEAVTKHAKRFSKTFGSGPWQTDFDAMAKKTVLKNILAGYAPLSVEMQQALSSDNEDYIGNQPTEQTNTNATNTGMGSDIEVEAVPVTEYEPVPEEPNAKEQQELLEAMNK